MGRPRKRWIITRWAFFRDLRWIVGKGWTARYQIEDTMAENTATLKARNPSK